MAYNAAAEAEIRRLAEQNGTDLSTARDQVEQGWGYESQEIPAYVDTRGLFGTAGTSYFDNRYGNQNDYNVWTDPNVVGLNNGINPATGKPYTRADSGFGAYTDAAQARGAAEAARQAAEDDDGFGGLMQLAMLASAIYTGGAALGAWGGAAATGGAAAATTASGMLAAESAAMLAQGFTAAEVAGSLAGLGSAAEIGAVLTAAGIPTAAASALATEAISGGFANTIGGQAAQSAIQSVGSGGGMFGNAAGAAYNPATATISDIINAAVSSGGNAVPAGMLTPELAAAAASGATISSLSPSLLSQLASGLNSALGTDLTGSQILSGGLSAIGGLLQGNAASNAAQTSADAQIRAAQIAADAAKFKPVGVTTRFGTSQFTKDAQGNVTGAGYTMPADIKAMQDQLLGAAPGMLNQFTGSVAATAPMGDAAQRAMSLGNQYLATDPLAQAKKYYDEQQAVMATGRERDQANMLTGEFNRGTYGLATGGTSGGMMAANPRLEAMYNAQRQQDLGLAAAATQGGMDYAKFGAGMVGTGGDLLKSMYGTQTASYSPFSTALSGAQTIEGLGQNALDMSVNIGKTASPAQSGQLLATGMLGAAQTMQPANSYSPWGSLFSGAGNSIQNWQNQQAQQQQNQQLLNAMAWGK